MLSTAAKHRVELWKRIIPSHLVQRKLIWTVTDDQSLLLSVKKPMVNHPISLSFFWQSLLTMQDLICPRWQFITCYKMFVLFLKKVIFTKQHTIPLYYLHNLPKPLYLQIDKQNHWWAKVLTNYWISQRNPMLWPRDGLLLAFDYKISRQDSTDRATHQTKMASLQPFSCKFWPLFKMATEGLIQPRRRIHIYALQFKPLKGIQCWHQLQVIPHLLSWQLHSKVKNETVFGKQLPTIL